MYGLHVDPRVPTGTRKPSYGSWVGERVEEPPINPTQPRNPVGWPDPLDALLDIDLNKMYEPANRPR